MHQHLRSPSSPDACCRRVQLSCFACILCVQTKQCRITCHRASASVIGIARLVNSRNGIALVARLRRNHSTASCTAEALVRGCTLAGSSASHVNCNQAAVPEIQLARTDLHDKAERDAAVSLPQTRYCLLVPHMLHAADAAVAGGELQRCMPHASRPPPHAAEAFCHPFAFDQQRGSLTGFNRNGVHAGVTPAAQADTHPAHCGAPGPDPSAGASAAAPVRARFQLGFVVIAV
jgi:hypothetical protein